MAQWFCKIDGQVYDEPADFETLQKRASEGRLRASDMVFTDGMADWQPAGTIPDLFAMVPPAIPVDLSEIPDPTPPPFPQPIPPRIEHHRGVMCLLFGILGIGCVVFSFVAWSLSDADLMKMRSGRMDSSGKTITSIGFALGCGFTLLYLLAIASLFVFQIIYAISQKPHMR